MIELLNKEEMTAIELSQSLRIPEKEVYEHLPHISRSVNSRGKRLVIRPAMCLKCGYAFKERRRFTRPGRCPRCRESHLQRPAYQIR
jgi:predicted Zn-ribbon and HTH transcriptional regulator